MTERWWSFIRLDYTAEDHMIMLVVKYTISGDMGYLSRKKLSILRFIFPAQNYGLIYFFVYFEIWANRWSNFITVPLVVVF